MVTPTSPLDKFISNIVNKPQVFFTADEKVAEQSLAMAKYFYSLAKKHEPQEFSPFPELLTEGFDHEQIWEEIATQNEPFLQYARVTVGEFGQKRRKVSEAPEHTSESDQESEGSVQGASESDEEALDDEDREIQDLEEELKQLEYELSQKEGQDNDSMEEDDMEDEDHLEEDDDAEEGDEAEEESEEEEPQPTKSRKGQSEVDDNFFDLDEFNKWTEKQEELDMMSDREDDDDGIDFDNDLDQLEDEEDEEEELDPADIKFNDFFVAPKKLRKQSKPKKGSFADDNDSEGEGESDQNDEETAETQIRNLFEADEEEDDDNTRSEFQKRQEKVQAQIEQYEQENIGDRHWALKGEASSKIRPVNSLLEEDLEFDRSAKVAPVITQEITDALEQIIKQRILDNKFDDVERKADPTFRPFLPSKMIEISDEKSKRSLAEQYEDDYMRQKTGDESNAKDEALKKEHDEIDTLFNTLCYKLDALSNFHYTPKAPKPEMTVVSNAAAISMEEVIPVNVSESTLLAPEEVYEKKHTEIKSKTEMDKNERKRARAAKKNMKRKERKLKEKERKVAEKANPTRGPGVKQAKIKAVKELMTQKNVEIIQKT